MPKQEVSPQEYERIKALLGVDAETFQRTKLGQYMLGAAEAQEQSLIEELIELALQSTDTKVMQRAVQIQAARMFPKYIEDAVESGRAAFANLQAMEDHQDY